MIQKTKAGRYSGGNEIKKAFCKTDAGDDNTIDCYLDEDLTDPPQDPPPEEIEVHCENMSNTSNLNSSTRRLEDGDRLNIYKDDDKWYCIEGFQGTEDYEAP